MTWCTYRKRHSRRKLWNVIRPFIIYVQRLPKHRITVFFTVLIVVAFFCFVRSFTDCVRASGASGFKFNASKSEVCPETPTVYGALEITMESPTFEEIANRNLFLQPGGYYTPYNCRPRYGLTVLVVPYRDRESHLRIFLNHIHPILQRQQLEYMIVVAEQSGQETFNRGLMLNIGYKEALKMLPENHTAQCFIFHDVDLLPESDTTVHTCKNEVVHLSGYMNKHGYDLLYSTFFGGVTAFPPRHFEAVNGYSNMFFGWGGEDDDLQGRITRANIPIIRPPREQLSYTMINHTGDSSNPVNRGRESLVNSGAYREPFDGLNSLTYRVLSRRTLPTHAHIVVEFTKAEVEKTYLKKQVEYGRIRRGLQLQFKRELNK